MPESFDRGVPAARGARRKRPRAAAAIVLVLVVAWLQPAIAAMITVSAERRGDMIEIQASATLVADATTAWQVLTDYGRYAEFIPDLRASRVVSRRGAIVTVEQSGDAVLWLLRVPLQITFEITETPFRELESHAVAGSLRALVSRYRLQPQASGVRLVYEGRVAPGWALLAPLEDLVVRRNVARQFQALADEIERMGAAASERAGPRPN